MIKALILDKDGKYCVELAIDAQAWQIISEHDTAESAFKKALRLTEEIPFMRIGIRQHILEEMNTIPTAIFSQIDIIP